MQSNMFKDYMGIFTATTIALGIYLILCILLKPSPTAETLLLLGSIVIGTVTGCAYDVHKQHKQSDKDNK